MTLKERMEQLNNLKEEYYDGMNDCDLEKLRSEFDELQLSKVDFIYDENHEHGELFVCPDTEWEFPKVYEVAEEFMRSAMDVIYDAIALYYKESDFWDEVTDLTSTELVKIYTRAHNIPIIRFFPVSKVELLNVTKLNKDIR